MQFGATSLHNVLYDSWICGSGCSDRRLRINHYCATAEASVYYAALSVNFNLWIDYRYHVCIISTKRNELVYWAAELIAFRLHVVVLWLWVYSLLWNVKCVYEVKAGFNYLLLSACMISIKKLISICKSLTASWCCVLYTSNILFQAKNWISFDA